MELVTVLCTALDIDAPRAELMAASALRSIEAAVAAKSPSAAKTLAEKVPELQKWRQSGKVVTFGSTPVQGLMGLSQLLLDRGLDPAKAMGLGSVVIGFLQDRGVFDVVSKAVPSIGGLGGAAGGGIGGLFGGMLGGGNPQGSN